MYPGLGGSCLRGQAYLSPGPPGARGEDPPLDMKYKPEIPPTNTVFHFPGLLGCLLIGAKEGYNLGEL